MHEKKNRWQLSTVRTESESGWIVRPLRYIFGKYLLLKLKSEQSYSEIGKNRMKKYGQDCSIICDRALFLRPKGYEAHENTNNI